MIKLYVEDIASGDVFSRRYDVSIFCCGYEERCTYLPSVLSKSKIGSTLVFDFSDNESIQDGGRSRNSRFFDELSGPAIKVEYSQSEVVVESLRRIIDILAASGAKSANVLVDYSSMPRLWAAEILNFFKNHDIDIDLVFDFVYSVGEHVYTDRPRQLREPIVLPGCEAVATYNKKTVAIFGLGFDSGAPICIHNMIEPDTTFALVARPGALEDYSRRAESTNSEFIEDSVSEVIYSPLASVKQTYDSMREIFYPYKNSATTVLVPFGPKPHALAAILAAMNHQGVACLHASTGPILQPITATTDLVMSRIFRLSDSDAGES
ncbi:hypothetical protein ACOXVJ_09655 [Pseudomonas knackmussii]|uniref:hypothetical protein n=1 Tax=Pseudomonas knackmussii TaxID=65741 RepID=UPI003BC830F9